MATKSLSTRNGPPGKAPSVGAPNQTLYVQNLPDKLRKPDLRLSLYTLFSTYGTVLDVVAMKTAKMRGQAHIVFRDVQSSTQALRALQGFDFFGKEMVRLVFEEGDFRYAYHWFQKIVYAKGGSNVIAKLRGTYVAPASQAPGAGIASDLQRSIFNAPPGSAVSAKPAEGANGEHPPQGVKRPREEESEGEAPMEEESDVSMDASSDED
ncbi:RNA recognition motif containing protein [Paecilomyces variotii No. 5]|uniref:RNA recognition motif containing protein n=1 Tax=Byssochlamys spectabilis (strain No. 5 / NBRC 109023) TaxID=1356009 RepID=V5FAQ7_BYSSN|nr:RNA recognition motif containing protein [Paecilomyces variotii No. 5]